jgi:hypothetical protein
LLRVVLARCRPTDGLATPPPPCRYLSKALEKEPNAATGFHDSHVEHLAGRAAAALEQCARDNAPAPAAAEAEAPLLAFLGRSSHYALDAALATCRALGLHRSTVFVLGRLCRPQDALELIFDQVRACGRSGGRADASAGRPLGPSLWSCAHRW